MYPFIKAAEKPKVKFVNERHHKTGSDHNAVAFKSPETTLGFGPATELARPKSSIPKPAKVETSPTLKHATKINHGATFRRNANDDNNLQITSNNK
mmetsp:Transcript_100843/g.289866  ORF Transcript_100843/g.289866 Transcript_100843/m.289866 type:complete len:96 (+) Transcript_100843:548-835(+)